MGFGPRLDVMSPPSDKREGSLEAPTRHPLDWTSEAFYAEEPLFEELERVYDICHGCRRCFNLCNSFPTLFDAIDESESMGARHGPEEGLLGCRRSLLPV